MKNSPMIIASGVTRVDVAPISTIDDLAALSDRFLNIAGEKCGAVLTSRLSTAVGDLASTVIDGTDATGSVGLYEEVADVIIAATMIGVSSGMEGSQLREAIRKRVEEMSSKVVAITVRETLQARGMERIL